MYFQSLVECGQRLMFKTVFADNQSLSHGEPWGAATRTYPLKFLYHPQKVVAGYVPVHDCGDLL